MYKTKPAPIPQIGQILPRNAGHYYSTSMVATYLGVSQGLVIEWIHRGWLRARRVYREQWRGPDTQYWYKIRRGAVKRALMDPRVIASMGNSVERQERFARSAQKRRRTAEASSG